MTAEDHIAAVEAVTVAMDLPAPLLLGSTEIRRREYVVATVRTADGLSGSSFSLTRGLPVATAIRSILGPLLLGTDADLVAAAWDRCYRATLAGGRTGLIMRGLSLIDIALWDIKAKRAGVPLWSMLGGFRTRVPVMVVGGYPRPGRTPSELGELASSYLGAGYPLVKLARLSQPEDTREMLAAASAGNDERSRLVVDAGWFWRSAHEALSETRLWGEVELAWLEDPMPPEDVAGCVALRSQSRFPIGIGDDLTDPHLLRSLGSQNALDVVRLDVTTVGGITAAAKVVAWAEAAGLLVSTHVYPEIHVHLCAGWSGCALLETFDPNDNPFDPASRLVRSELKLGVGIVEPPRAPGLGFELDHELIDHHRLD